jgi:hypothetical protein
MGPFAGFPGLMPTQGMQPPAPMGGLLGMPGMDPQKMGLLAAAFQGLKASGNSRMPVTLGQTIGEAGNAGMDAMRQGQNDQMKQQTFGMQAQMQALQMQEHAAKVKRTQEMEALMPMFAKDPAAALMARSGDFKGAIERIYPREEFDVKEVQGPNGPTLSYIPKRPGAGQVTPTGAAPYQKPSLEQLPVPGQPGVTQGKWLTPGQTDGPAVGAPNMPEILNPAVQAAKTSIARAGKPDINTQVTLKQEGEEAKTVGKFFGENYADVQKAGFNAQSRINRANRLNELLENVTTGKLTPMGTEVAAIAESLGIKIDKKLGNKQAAQALANEMALELRNPAGGAGMPGAMSDADREFLKSMTPGLGTSPEGRKQITETSIKIAKRDQQVAKLARDYRQKNGSIDEGFYNVLAEFSAKNPLFGGPAVSDVRSQADAILKGK